MAPCTGLSAHSSPSHAAVSVVLPQTYRGSWGRLQVSQPLRGHWKGGLLLSSLSAGAPEGLSVGVHRHVVSLVCSTELYQRSIRGIWRQNLGVTTPEKIWDSK